MVSAEEEAAEFLKKRKNKKTNGWVYCGFNRSSRKKNGSCWRHYFRGKGGAEDKIEVMKSAGITISKSPADIGKTLIKNLMVDF